MTRGRKPQIGYYRSKNGYFITVNGKRYRLSTGPDDSPDGPVYRAATIELDRISKRQDILAKQKVSPDTVTAAVNLYVTRNGKLHPSALKERSLFRKINSTIGNIDIVDIEKHHVNRWLDSHPMWNNQTRHTAFGRLKSAISWYVQQGYVQINPLLNIQPSRCEKHSRDGGYVLDADVIKEILTAAPKRFRDFLLAVYVTGARPGEIANAKVSHYDRNNGGKIVFKGDTNDGYIWKNAKKTSTDRVILLLPVLCDIIEKNIDDGYEFLFPSSKGGMMRSDTITKSMAAIRRNCDVKRILNEKNINPSCVICYALRHSYATNSLSQ